MITTLTPNPSLDRTISVPELLPGAVLRTATATVEAGGKGVNVARALMANGVDASAIFPAGGSSGQLFADLLVQQSVPAIVVPVADGSVRSNISVIEASGRTTKLNEPGHRLDDGTLGALVDVVVDAGRGSEWIAACGSLPPGAPETFYADLAQRLAPANAQLAVDTSGPALDHMVGVECGLLKPNRHELAAMLNIEVSTVGEALGGARQLVVNGATQVLVSLGSDGAILATSESAWFATAIAAEVRNTVGAGDSLLAGFLAVGGQGEEALRSGLAWARAAIRTETTMMSTPTTQDFDAVTIRSFDEGHSLTSVALKDDE